MEGGFIARTTVFEADARAQGEMDGIVSIPEQLIEETKYWLDFIPPAAGDIAAISPGIISDPLVIPATATGQRALVACRAKADKRYAEVEYRGEAGAAAVWSRVYEQTEKLATLYAVSENYREPKIDESAVQWGNGIVTWSAHRSLALAIEYGAETDFAKKCNRLLRVVNDFGGQASQREIQRKVKWLKKDLSDCAATLIDQGRLKVAVNHEKPGPPQIIFNAIQEQK